MITSYEIAQIITKTEVHTKFLKLVGRVFANSPGD